MRFWTVTIVVALLSVSVMAQDKAAEKDSDKIRIVTTGEIRKIDAKNKTFQFRITLDSFPGGGQRPQNGGGRGGGRGRRGGGGNPFPFPGGQGRGNGPTPIPVIEVKVFTSEKTALKDSDSAFTFSSLKVGQRVAVTGIHKGKGNDIEALEVDKTSP